MEYLRNIELGALKAMAEAAQNITSAYTVERTSRHRVRISYTNPFYEHDKPIVAFYPCYKGSDGKWWVVIAIIRITGCQDDRHVFYAHRHFGWTETSEVLEVSDESTSLG